LIRLRIAKDTPGLMDALAVCVRSNFAGTEGVKMYSEVSCVLIFSGFHVLREAVAKETDLFRDETNR
jgi:hypothetical protein